MSDDADKALAKKYGNNIFNGDLIIEEEREIFSFSPSIDLGLFGGIVEGSWVILSGKEKCGKTLSGLHLMRKYQTKGRKCFFVNIEGRIKRRDLLGIRGLNPNDVTIIGSTKGNILSGENFANIMADIIRSYPGCYMLVDSASAICSTKELTEEITGTGRVLGPRIMAAFTRQMATVVPIQKVTLVLIQHLIANTSGFGASQYEDGGRKVKYQGDVHLRCTKADKWIDTKGKLLGQKPTWQVMYSSLGPPGMQVESYIRYNEGIDEITEIINLAADFGVISQKGSWFCVGEEKFQGQDKLYAFLCENPDILDDINKQVKNVVYN